MRNGFVSIVGAGPGNPDFLTLIGYRTLQSADVILYDALLGESFKDIFPKKAQTFYVGKRCSEHSISQKELNNFLVKLAKEGKHVVRLKGGDPLLFGRGGEEALALRQFNIPFKIIPGISSLNSIGGLCGVPLTHRGVSNQVHILEGHNLENKKIDWSFLARFDGTIVCFMATKKIQYIAQQLLENGSAKELPICLIESEGCSKQILSTSIIKDVALKGLDKKTSGPGLIYIGKTILLQPELKGSNNQIGELEYVSVTTSIS